MPQPITLFNVYLLILKENERENKQGKSRERERERERKKESQAGCVPSTEPDVGLDLTTPAS